MKGKNFSDKAKTIYSMYAIGNDLIKVHKIYTDAERRHSYS